MQTEYTSPPFLADLGLSVPDTNTNNGDEEVRNARQMTLYTTGRRNTPRVFKSIIEWYRVENAADKRAKIVWWRVPFATPPSDPQWVKWSDLNVSSASRGAKSTVALHCTPGRAALPVLAAFAPNTGPLTIPVIVTAASAKGSRISGIAMVAAFDTRLDTAGPVVFEDVDVDDVFHRITVGFPHAATAGMDERLFVIRGKDERVAWRDIEFEDFDVREKAGATDGDGCVHLPSLQHSGSGHVDTNVLRRVLCDALIVYWRVVTHFVASETEEEEEEGMAEEDEEEEEEEEEKEDRKRKRPTHGETEGEARGEKGGEARGEEERGKKNPRLAEEVSAVLDSLKQRDAFYKRALHNLSVAHARLTEKERAFNLVLDRMGANTHVSFVRLVRMGVRRLEDIPIPFVESIALDIVARTRGEVCKFALEMPQEFIATLKEEDSLVTHSRCGWARPFQVMLYNTFASQLPADDIRSVTDVSIWLRVKLFTEERTVKALMRLPMPFSAPVERCHMDMDTFVHIPVATLVRDALDSANIDIKSVEQIGFHAVVGFSTNAKRRRQTDEFIVAFPPLLLQLLRDGSDSREVVDELFPAPAPPLAAPSASALVSASAPGLAP